MKWLPPLQVEDQSRIPHKSPMTLFNHTTPPSQNQLSFRMLHYLLCHSDTRTEPERNIGRKIGVVCLFCFAYSFRGLHPVFIGSIASGPMVEWQNCFSCGRQEAEDGRKRQDKCLRVLLIGTNFLQVNFSFHCPTQPNSLLRCWICQFTG